MEQFSHDLTLALEETSRVRAGHCWGVRRRTRSTGNLPCAPLPTEDSSSPADAPHDVNEGATNSILSDSDDRQNFKLALQQRQSCLFGNFESDSLNENFSPTRPNTRRKRKFKRMAVEYETTPSTPGNTNSGSMFPLIGNAVKKRVMKHTCQENFRANLFFCGKRKRSHRDRYHDYEYYRSHSSSVPRQRDLFTPKGSYLEYRNRNRSSYLKPCERIMPLNKNIVSKIEKISQESNKRGGISVPSSSSRTIIGFPFNTTCLSEENNCGESSGTQVPAGLNPQNEHKLDQESFESSSQTQMKSFAKTTTMTDSQNKLATKSGSFESTFGAQDLCTTYTAGPTIGILDCPKPSSKDASRKNHHHVNANHKQKKSKRLQMKMQLQFDDPNGMDCGNLNDFLSSSSLSSSDSEAAETNESDREGDDELTDWPGNEAMVNFASKNDFKRAKPPRNSLIANKSTLSLIKGVNEEVIGQDDDTLMSTDESAIPANTINFFAPSTSASVPQVPPISLHLPLKFAPAVNTLPSTDPNVLLTNNSNNNNLLHISTQIARSSTSMPIDIRPNIQQNTSNIRMLRPSPLQNQIESEMSGETSNHFLSSPNMEVREIRAGCRRIRDERPGFTIFTSLNEHLSRFLQDSRQTQLILPYTDTEENDKLIDLAKLYSLNMKVENGRAIFSKTINTTQSVKIDQTNISKLLLSDYKRRCYGAEDDSESAEMAS